MVAERTFVIGDLHGCVEEIDRMLDACDLDASDTVVCLGDYVDRGQDSKGVIDRLLRLRREGPRCVFLKGNHEDMFLAYLGRPGMYGDAFLFNGGGATLHSYGLEGFPPAVVAERMLPDHLEFLLSLRLMYECGEYLCVHAGVAPDRPLDMQEPEDLLWIRDAFIVNPHPFPCTVLFGHTPHREVLVDLPYKIGLDTGLVYWNKLSCLELSTMRLSQIQRGAGRVTHCSLPPACGSVPRGSVSKRATAP
jgi:serine/threonine protein phosphatase 1